MKFSRAVPAVNSITTTLLSSNRKLIIAAPYTSQVTAPRDIIIQNTPTTRTVYNNFKRGDKHNKASFTTSAVSLNDPFGAGSGSQFGFSRSAAPPPPPKQQQQPQQPQQPQPPKQQPQLQQQQQQQQQRVENHQQNQVQNNPFDLGGFHVDKYVYL